MARSVSRKSTRKVAPKRRMMRKRSVARRSTRKVASRKMHNGRRMHGMMQKIKEKAKAGYQKVKAGAKRVGKAVGEGVQAVGQFIV